MDFMQFCSLPAEGFVRLRQRVDACARMERSYEFPACRLPEGCTPARADLGFWKRDGSYYLYLRPAVSCSDGGRFTDFFSQPVRRFPDFPALERCLSGLAEAPAQPFTFPALCAALGEHVVGQDAAVEAAAFRLYGHVRKRDPLRPLSLILYGPTGVGKSQLAKAVAPALNRCLGQERYRTVWTELNTFSQAHSVFRLSGAPPGYVGYDDPPVLEAVREHPYTVFVFDELDKAHPDILKVFMSILDEGRCAARRPDGNGGRELDFRRCVLVFTTNADLSAPERRLGFFPAGAEQKKAAGPADPVGLAQRLFQADEAARCALSRSGVLREIAGRFSGLIGFQPLGPDARREITSRQITALGREYGLEFSWIDPCLVRSLTPDGAFSQRSVTGVLEGALTPVFLTRAGEGPGPFRLALGEDGPALCPASRPGVPA